MVIFTQTYAVSSSLNLLIRSSRIYVLKSAFKRKMVAQLLLIIFSNDVLYSPLHSTILIFKVMPLFFGIINIFQFIVSSKDMHFIGIITYELVMPSSMLFGHFYLFLYYIYCRRIIFILLLIRYLLIQLFSIFSEAQFCCEYGL